MKMKIGKIFLGIGASALLMGATTVASAETIRIAIAGPVTGPVTQYGDMVRAGAQLAIEQINAAGGVDGNKLEAVIYDDACDPKQAVAVANKVVNDGIKFVVGHVCSSSTTPATDIYEDEGVLMVTPSATAPEITARGYKLIFRTIGLDNLQGPISGRFILDKYKDSTIAILHDKQQYGEGIATEVKKTLEAGGVKVALFEGLNAGDKDYSALIAKLKRANVNFVYFGGYHPEMGLLLRQSKQAGLNARFMGPEGVGNSEITAIAGDASEGMYTALPRAFEEDPKNKDLVEALKAKKQDPTGIFVMPSYSAVSVIAQAIDKADSTDPEKVAQALRSNSFETPTGTLTFDEKGDLKSFDFVIYEWHKDGTKTEAK